MKTSKEQSQPDIGAAAILILYMRVGQFNARLCEKCGVTTEVGQEEDPLGHDFERDRLASAPTERALPVAPDASSR